MSLACPSDHGRTVLFVARLDAVGCSLTSPAGRPYPTRRPAPPGCTRHRKAYQRAVLVPTQQLEALWKGYESFEMAGGNKVFARKVLDEWRPRFQLCRQALRDRRRKLEGLALGALPFPPGKGGSGGQGEGPGRPGEGGYYKDGRGRQVYQLGAGLTRSSAGIWGGGGGGAGCA